MVENENARVGLRLNYKWDGDAALNVYQRSDQFPNILTVHDFGLHDGGLFIVGELLEDEELRTQLPPSITHNTINTY